MNLRPTERFSNRVENYVKYRPGYPPAVVEVLAQQAGLTPASVIADVGCGTGLLAKLFLDHGHRVYGVEPNPEMRAAGEHFLAGYPRFTSVAAPAEATTLPDGSVDFVVAGQAFHWFDADAARREFVRILKPGGQVALVWNDRETATSPFLRDYEQVLHTYALDYASVTHKEVSEDALRAWFGSSMQVASFENSQTFDLDGLKGRLLSSSYAPLPGHPTYAPMIEAIEAVFGRHAVDGQVAFLYTTVVYFGPL